MKRVVLLAVLLMAWPAVADTVHSLPFANVNGYETTAVITNPTWTPIDVIPPCRVGPCVAYRIQPQRTVRIPAWPRSGVDVEDVALDPALIAYSEIKTPYGTIAYLPSLALREETAWFYDLPDPGKFEGYIFAAVAPGQEGTFLTIIDEGNPDGPKSFLMGRGAIIEAVVGPVVRVVPGAAPGWPALPAPSGFRAFAFTVHDATGAITPSVDK